MLHKDDPRGPTNPRRAAYRDRIERNRKERLERAGLTDAEYLAHIKPLIENTKRLERIRKATGAVGYKTLKR